FFKELTDPKMSNHLRDETAEFNAMVAALQDGNTPVALRAELMEQINKKYAEYLPNLLTEQNYLKLLDPLQKEVNKNLEENIRISATRELEKEAFSDLTTATNDYFQA